MKAALVLLLLAALSTARPIGRDAIGSDSPPRDQVTQLGSDPLGTGIGRLPSQLLEAAQLRRRHSQGPAPEDGHGVSADIFCGPSDGSDHPQPANPFIGSGGEGFGVGTLNPGASVPFGLVRAGPDTCDKDGVRIQWEQCAGYSSCDDHIRAFSHTHTVGAGVMDYGNVGIMPTVGFTPAKTACVQPVKSDDYFRACPFRARFSHATEIAYPGFYSTVLYDDSTAATINVSLTATDHAAVHTYQWASPSRPRADARTRRGRRGARARAEAAADEDRVVIVDLCHMVGMAKTIQDSCPNASVAIDYGAGEVTGWMHAIGDYSKRFDGFIIHFVMRFNTSFDPASSGTWQNGTAYPGSTSLNGVEVGAYLNFGSIASSFEAVQVAIGISFIDGDHARRNLEEEVGDWDFQQTLDSATARWAQALGVVEVTGGSPSDRSKFYTALYHAFLAPTNFTESGGDYLGFDGAVHSDVENFFSDLSIWDIYRSQFPLLTFLQPRVATNIMESMLAMNRQQGRLPKWAMGPADANGMNGLHSVAMLTDGALARMPEAAALNLTEALMAAVNSLNQVEPSDYRTKGYVANSPCDTLEYSVDDHCTARLAELVGDSAVQDQFNQSSQNWRNVFDSETQFMCAKDGNGSWVQCRSPLWPLLALNVFSDYYVEGDAWHYRWNVPQDFPSLIAAFPSVDEFVSQLDFFFNQSSRSAYDFLPNMYYWAGNEPSILSAYGFVHAGRPDLMHKYTREMMGLRYTTTTSGLPGNDDYGTMSAWFVWNAMGLYPQPCQGTFAITSPLFDSVLIHRAEGDIKILVTNNSPANVYVSAVTVNGQPLPASQWLIDQSLLRKGGATIELTMSATPPQL